jgi:hypothetical protein
MTFSNLFLWREREHFVVTMLDIKNQLQAAETVGLIP